MSLRDIAIMAVVLFLVFSAAQLSVQSFRVQGSSMEPSFQDSQYLIVDKLRYRFSDPGRGDVIIFQNPTSPAELYIKRVIGLPGEKVDLTGGLIRINGVPLEEQPLFEPVPSSYHDYSTTVPQDSYFVMGDNRRTSSGSHIFQSVPRDNIIGRVWIRYWPLSEMGLSPSYSTQMEQTLIA